MTDTSMVPRKPDGHRPASPPLIDEELADQLLGKAQAEGVELLERPARAGPSSPRSWRSRPRSGGSSIRRT
jgi:hypothetical protein